MTGSLPDIEISSTLPAKPRGRSAALVIGFDGQGRPLSVLPWLDAQRRSALRRGAALFPPKAEAGVIVGPLPGFGPNGEPAYLLRLSSAGRAAGAGRKHQAGPRDDPEAIGDAAVRRLAADGHDSVVLLPGAGRSGSGKPGLTPADRLARMLLGAGLAAYRFDYRTQPRKDDPARVSRILLVAPNAASVRRAWTRVAPDLEGIGFVRDLVNEPGNRLYPASFADRIVRHLKPLGIDVEILQPPALRKLSMGALLAVGSGSAHTPRLVVMRWPGRRNRKSRAPVALVGKGVTFDTGGISIKPGARMEEMKGDMAGAAAVAGTMLSLARRQHVDPVVGVVPLVENMPSGTSFRPGDVVQAHDGRTIEIVDTDAEGRLILADALAYTAKRFKPRAIVDMATLTGSVIAALGHLYAGIFANDDRLAATLIEAGAAVGERLWRLPLDPDYETHLKSDIADIRQCAPDEESADAVHAAQFLQGFAGDNLWAHLDIAGVEYLRGEGRHGGSGFAVRLLARWLTGN